MNLTEDHFITEQAVAAYHDEYDRWGTRQLLPARAGKPINEWMQVEATWPLDVLRRNDAGEHEVKFTGPGDEGRKQFFKRREMEAMRAALVAANVARARERA